MEHLDQRDIFMQNIFQFCFNKFENDDNPNNNNLETAKQLWTYLSSLPLDTIKANFKTTRYQNTILLKMASIEVVDDNQNSTCMQSMKYSIEAMTKIDGPPGKVLMSNIRVHTHIYTLKSSRARRARLIPTRLERWT